MPPREDGSLPARIQARLSRLYGIGEAPPVDDFIEASDHDDREVLILVDRGAGGEVELSLRLPRSAATGRPSFDQLCQIVEGVSHFLYVVERARRELPATQLELELQAEVDKYVTCLLVHGPEVEQSATLRRRLFGDAEYELDLDDDEHDRYRAANDNAHRYATYLEDAFIARRRIPEMLGELRRFYRHGLAQKLSTIARAA
jgi:hypothetical protein